VVVEVVAMEITEVWDVTPCSSVNNYKRYRFGSWIMEEDEIEMDINRNRARWRGLD
jgi:hypothetical protein